MNADDNHGGQQQITGNALPAMGHDPSAEGFDPRKVNLVDFQRRIGPARSKARTPQKKGFRPGHGRCGMSSETTGLTGFTIKGAGHRGAGLETFSAEAIPSAAKLPAKKHASLV